MASVADSSTSVRRRRCCSVSYKVRCFYSKGAFLIIFWTTLISLSAFYMCFEQYDIFFKQIENKVYNKVALIPAVPFFLCAPIVGWIADTHSGNYRVFKVGAILTLLATIFAGICSMVMLNVTNSMVSQVISYGVSPLVYIIATVGGTSCIVTAVQLGLDQMPDASSANITSFIVWFVFAFIIGAWLNDAMKTLLECISMSSSQVFNLLPAILMTVVCSSLFLFGKKWLIIEPNCRQSLKTVYQVLRYTWNHKSPLNHGALVSRGEDLPSRIDVGKSRYGGPFNSEQVEDVKILFKILVLLLPVFISFCSFFPIDVPQAKNISAVSTICENNLVHTFTYGPASSMIIAVLLNEFIIYPLIRNWHPSIFKRLGIVLFLFFAFSFIQLVMAIVDLSSSWYNVVYYVPLCCLLAILIPNILEFACAQSPYIMRGLLLGFAVFMCTIALAIYQTIHWVYPGAYIISKACVFAAFSLFGFVFYCLLARWYKMRVRDEEYNVHRVVEEVYDRYLSQRPMVN